MSKRPGEQASSSGREKQVKLDAEEGEVEGGDLHEADILKQMLGFDGFGTTKNTHVKDNSTTAARGGRAPKQTRKARQYMNLKKNQPNNKGEAGEGADKSAE